MALQLAPWLQPPDYLQAIDRGAGLGIQLRRNDLEEQQMAQRAREQQAQLQQSWAAKMLDNQRMREQNQMQLQQDAMMNEQRNSRPLTLSPGEAALNPLTGQPIYTNPNRPTTQPSSIAVSPGSTVFDRTTGQPIFTAPPKPTETKLPEPIKLTSEQLKDWERLERNEIEFKAGPQITPGTFFRPGVTNTPSGNTPDGASRLQTYRRNQALLNGGTNAPMFAPATPLPTAGNPGGGTLTGRVRVVGPNGKTGTVSASSLEEALRSGYKQVE